MQSNLTRSTDDVKSCPMERVSIFISVHLLIMLSIVQVPPFTIPAWVRLLSLSLLLRWEDRWRGRGESRRNGSRLRYHELVSVVGIWRDLI